MEARVGSLHVRIFFTWPSPQGQGHSRGARRTTRQSLISTITFVHHFCESLFSITFGESLFSNTRFKHSFQSLFSIALFQSFSFSHFLSVTFFQSLSFNHFLQSLFFRVTFLLTLFSIFFQPLWGESTTTLTRLAPRRGVRVVSSDSPPHLFDPQQWGGGHPLRGAASALPLLFFNPLLHLVQQLCPTQAHGNNSNLMVTLKNKDPCAWPG